MLTQEFATLEQTKEGFALEKLFEIRARTLDAVNRIAEQVYVGMLEEDANKMAIATLQAMGTRQGWHKPFVRFGSNTVKTFGADSDPGIRLGEDDIYFIDIGPVWEGYEGDAGNTFVMGNDADLQRCASDTKQIFDAVADKWKTERYTGQALYQFAEQMTKDLGWELNLDLSGHRLGDFPHEAYYKGSLAEVPFHPSSKLWVLEIQIRHPEKPFGAFFEDILI